MCVHHTAHWCVFSISRRHQCWLHFWKIHINPEKFIFLHFWDNLGQKFQKWPYFWALEKKRLKFWPKKYILWFKNGILEFLYKYKWIFKTSFKKFYCRTLWITWEKYKKLKTVEFINMWLFIFASAKNSPCLIRPWTGKFMVDKLQFFCR